jgi:hypothetical protein
MLIIEGKFVEEKVRTSKDKIYRNFIIALDDDTKISVLVNDSFNLPKKGENVSYSIKARAMYSLTGAYKPFVVYNAITK